MYGAADGVGSVIERPQSRLILPLGCVFSGSFSFSLWANEVLSRKEVEVGSQDMERSLKPFLSGLAVFDDDDPEGGCSLAVRGRVNAHQREFWSVVLVV